MVLGILFLDKSKRESSTTTLKITKKHILGKSELSPVKMSGKSDTSTHQPKKNIYEKKKKRTDERSKRSGKPDFEKFHLIQLPTIFRQK